MVFDGASNALGYGVCDTVAEPDCFEKMLVCVLRLRLQNVAVSKSRHQLLFYPTGRKKAQKNSLFEILSTGGRL